MEFPKLLLSYHGFKLERMLKFDNTLTTDLFRSELPRV